mgnify:CR=1 FL=1
MGQNEKRTSSKKCLRKPTPTKKKVVLASSGKKSVKATDDKQLLKDWEHVT